MANCNKHDTEAQATWGAAYDAIPKSVFALVAFHLADCLGEGDAIGRFREELEALRGNAMITESQAKRALAATTTE